MTFIPVAGPSITEREISYVAEAAATAWYGNANLFNVRFEDAFKRHCGRRHAVSLPSCTSALHLALLALGIGEGDEVVVPDATWIASAAPISYVGATPVFADIDPNSWCLSATSLADVCTPRTRAAIVVDLYGGMPDWDALTKVARDRGIVLIEDAAEAIGSRWHDRPAGSFGAFSAFSFHGSKTVTTGEGGMLVLDDDSLFDRVSRLRDHGRRPGDTMFRNQEIGYKYKMSSLQAAMGLAQIERLDELLTAKRRIFGWYGKHLAGWDGGALTPDVEGVFNSYWMSTILLEQRPELLKDHVIPRLREKGIDSRPFFDPLSSIPAYADSHAAAAGRERNRHAYAVTPRGLNLPSALSLTEADVSKVCDALREIHRDLLAC